MILIGRFALADQRVVLGVERDGSRLDLSGTELPTLAALLALPKSELLPGLEAACRQARPLVGGRVLAPLDEQEVWAAGVTYRRSRDARMEESSEASVYDRVYGAARPEIFLKATPSRVVDPGEALYLRSDAHWNVPEPELVLVMNSQGEIAGYTVGNDLSSRDIEGENPLYLPQAKVWHRACALGPLIALDDGTFDATNLPISCTIVRAGQTVFHGETSSGEIVRPYPELAEYLFRDQHFPAGCFLLTGTGIVPPDAFTLESGDEVEITIAGLGTLRNSIRRHGA